MTALTQYQRLESPAVWHESPDSQRRDVHVSLGEATLVIKDQAETALTHWSLAALVRIAPGNSPAIFAPGPEDDERLELTDADMIAALDTVRRAVARSRPQRGRLRILILSLIFAAIVALGVLWLPGALITHTASALPEATRQDVGRRLVIALEPFLGRPCRDIAGRRALAKLQLRLFGTAPWELRVLEHGQDVKALPGGILLVGGDLLTALDGPDALAGHVLAAATASLTSDPMLWFLDSSGAWQTFRMLTTGEVPQDVLDAAADRLAVTEVARPVDAGPLLARFAEAELSARPYGMSAGPGDEVWIEMVEGDPFPGGSPVAVLTDADWLRLQAICN